MFPTNQAVWDRVLRILIGLVMLVVGALGLFNEPWNMALVIFAFYPFITGASGWCPVYVLLEYSTRRNGQSR
jgi:hypothetical protein